MGLLVFDALAMLLDKKQETIDWLRSCQLENGGFTYALHAMLAAIDHVDYTWAALKALKLLGAVPKDPAGVRAYLTSLWNHDGGFGDRPGRASNPLAMRQALEALDILGHSEGTENAVPLGPCRKSRSIFFHQQLPFSQWILSRLRSFS